MTRWSGLLGTPNPVDPQMRTKSTRGIPVRAGSATEAQVAIAVARATRLLPFDATCLAQAAAGQVMLRRRGEPGTVVIGLRPPSDGSVQGFTSGWDAHAWLLGTAGALTGGPAAAGFTATTAFRAPESVPLPLATPLRRSRGPAQLGFAPSVRTPTASGLVAAAVSSVVRASLEHSEGVEPVTTPEESHPMTWPVQSAVAFHRVEQVVASHCLELGLAPETAFGLRAMARSSRMAALAAAGDTVRVSSALAAGGVPHLVLKGVVLAKQTTGSVVGRGGGDVDVLVDPASVASAVDALLDVGLTLDGSIAPVPSSPLYPATFRVRKESVLWLDERPVDVHWRLDDAPSCLNWTFDELLTAAEWLPIGGVDVPALGRMHAAIFMASHAARDSAWDGLRCVVDQALILRGLDQRQVLEEAWRVGGGRRMELAYAMVDLLTGERHPGIPPSTRRLARHLWNRMLREQVAFGRRGPETTFNSFATSILTQDSTRGVAQRLETLMWPAGEMAGRSLGDVGDRHPWLYAAAAPYMLPKRLIRTWSPSER